MAAPTQRGEIPAALAALFALKGHTPLLLDEVAVPVVSIANMTDSPYMRYAFPVIGHMQAAALAANFGYVIARPGAGKVLQVRQVVFKTSDAAAQDINVRVGSAAFVAQLDTPIADLQMVDISGGPAPKLASSRMSSFHDVAGTDTGSQSIGSFWVPPAVSVILTYPEPGVCIFADDDGGIPCYAVRNATLNKQFAVTIMGREWPLAGR